MEMAGAALFIGVFGFLAIAAWAGARASERKAQARYSLLAKAAEQPTESARLIIEFLREDEAKREREKAVQSRRDGMLGGLVVTAAGVGLSVLLYYLTPYGQPVWLVGQMVILVGVVILGFAYFAKPKASQ